MKLIYVISIFAVSVLGKAYLTDSRSRSGLDGFDHLDHDRLMTTGDSIKRMARLQECRKQAEIQDSLLTSNQNYEKVSWSHSRKRIARSIDNNNKKEIDNFENFKINSDLIQPDIDYYSDNIDSQLIMSSSNNNNNDELEIYDDYKYDDELGELIRQPRYSNYNIHNTNSSPTSNQKSKSSNQRKLISSTKTYRIEYAEEEYECKCYTNCTTYTECDQLRDCLIESGLENFLYLSQGDFCSNKSKTRQEVNNKYMTRKISHKTRRLPYSQLNRDEE